MKLIDKLKSYIKKEEPIEKDTTQEQACMIFDMILEEFYKYENELELLKENPNQINFDIESFQDNIINLAKENLDCLSITNVVGENLGMIAADKGLEKFVCFVLDDEKASIQKDIFGKNIGMKAALNNMQKAVLKALDNPVASIQQNADGKNIGMYCAIECNEEAVLKALENPIAAIQQSKIGRNIGMYCAVRKMEVAVLKALENKEASLQQDKDGINIGMLAAKYGLENAAIEALDNPDASVQQDHGEMNIGMHCAENKLEIATLVALKNDVARNQVDLTNSNIAHFAVDSKLENVVLKVFDCYPECLEQKNSGGENIAVASIFSGLQSCVMRALDFEELCLTSDDEEVNLLGYLLEFENKEGLMKAVANPKLALTKWENSLSLYEALKFSSFNTDVYLEAVLRYGEKPEMFDSIYSVKNDVDLIADIVPGA